MALAAPCLIGAAQLVTSLGTTFQRLNAGHAKQAALPANTKKIAIYYGASWCGPCRAFVPELKAAYPKLRARNIEVVFLSDDATCATALDYARASRMPWLLLPCEPHRRSALRALAGKALPGIVVTDRAGVRLATSWRSDADSTPRRLLSEMLD